MAKFFNGIKKMFMASYLDAMYASNQHQKLIGGDFPYEYSTPPKVKFADGSTLDVEISNLKGEVNSKFYSFDLKFDSDKIPVILIDEGRELKIAHLGQYHTV